MVLSTTTWRSIRVLEEIPRILNLIIMWTELLVKGSGRHQVKRGLAAPHSQFCHDGEQEGPRPYRQLRIPSTVRHSFIRVRLK
jgi:hypothetical protein